MDTSAATASYTIGSQNAGSNGWKKSLTIKVTATDSESGISSAKYCTTTSSTCTPSSVASLSTGTTSKTFNVTFPNNASAQRVCVKITNGAGKESGVLCDSTTYKVDGAVPTITGVNLSVSGTTITASLSGASDTGGSSIGQYVFQLGSNSVQTSTTNSMQFTGLTRGTSYTVKGYIVDKAGNSSGTKSASITVPYPPASDTLKNVGVVTSGEGLYSQTSTLAGWTAAELRYTGSVPNNYVTFNGESWRIIGLVNVLTTSNVVTQRIKIIKTDSLGNMAWNTNNTNNWTTSTLKDYLNGTYLNGLSATAKNMIAKDIRWSIGARNSVIANVSEWYAAERGSVGYNGNPVTWDGQIGLISVSDYAYATSGGGLSRYNCITNIFGRWDYTEFLDCSAYDWIKGNDSEWMITTHSERNDVYYNYWKHYQGASSTQVFGVRPALYLSANVQISGGNGTSGNPFKLVV